MENKEITEKRKKYEGSPKIVKIFSEFDISELTKLYNSLPITVENKKQNVVKKRYLQGFNKEFDKKYICKLENFFGDFEMDNLQSDDGEEFYGLFHESFSPLKLHVDSGFDENAVSTKQILIPMSEGETILFKNRWYGKSTSFTIDENEIKMNKNLSYGQNSRSSLHTKIYGDKPFNKEFHQRYLMHEDIKNLHGLEVELIYKWKIGEGLIFDRSHLHCSSHNINKKKLGLTTWTKKRY